MLPGVALLAVFGDRLGAWLRRARRANLALSWRSRHWRCRAAWALRRWSRRRRRRERRAARRQLQHPRACVGRDGRQDVGRIAAVLREIDADVVGLQEVESRHGRSAIDQAEALAAALDMECIEGPLLHQAERGWYGNALLTRPAVRAVAACCSRTTARGPGRDRRRSARGRRHALARADHPPRPALRQRRRQFEMLLDAPGAELTRPTALIGDFNEWWPFSRGLDRPAAPRRAAVFARRPFRPGFRRSATAWRSRPAACGARLRRHLTPLSRIASDHLPIFADLIADAAMPVAFVVRTWRATPVPAGCAADGRRRSCAPRRNHGAGAVLAADLPAGAPGELRSCRGHRASCPRCAGRRSRRARQDRR